MKSLLLAGVCALALSATAAQAGSTNPMAGVFAQGAALSNDFEIAESKIILEDSTNPTLRAFAQEMVHDHGQAQAALKQAGRSAMVQTSFVFDKIDQGKVDDLGLMDGQKLDNAYLADQIAAHAQAAAALSDYAATGMDPALRAYARQTLPVVLHHRQMLVQISGQPAPL